ncbi:hemagglutinin repeat-containing protein [Dickeya zeae]|uniref:hemagglutinin repeat-containing protein n=1 Tax=Dickeya zeae TaxID=204042 RepID=UPI001CF2F496|nr:hemagglutinin repeat-containing protein [Dickeya zeae]MCA6987172.1 hemagglutinin repeat-containing protein [Dickeya zeae]
MKAVKLSQRVMVWCLVWLTGLQPLLPAWAAGVTVASGNTTLEAAGNGVPVVNIATPNAAGLSHNRYNDFNVDNRGLILNNGTAQLTPSQQGGLLQNNPNLNGRAASAIINEVVSPNRSHLAGYLEVAGQAASVMVANPYGITCSGCGFINTPRITLTTGTPQFDAAGGLSGLDVRGGDILVDGAGLDASRSDYFALIARTATLQAGLNARDAQVVLGANRVGTDGRITPQAGSGATPVLALDTGALGGMYANRISLVSTEQGVGVNTAGLSARQGDIQLSANGRLQVGSAIAQGNITAQGGTLVVAGDQQAQGAVALRGEQGITLGASRTQAGQGLTLSSDGRISADRARLSAGVSDSGTVQPGYGLTLSGTALALGQSQLAGDRLSLTSTGAVSQLAGGAWQAGSGLTLKGDALSLDGDAGAQTLTVSGGSLSGAGRWQSTGDLSLGGLTTAQWDGTLLAGGTLSLDSASLSNRGTLAGGQVQLTTPVLDNRGTVSGRQVRLQAGQLGNSGTLSADEGLSIQAQTGLDNSGSLLSGGGLTIAAGQTVNRGVLSGGAVTLSGDSLWNGGVLQGRQSLGVNALTGFSQTADGVLTSGGTVTLSSGTVDTAGGLSAQGLQLHTRLWRNQGTVNLGGDGQLTLEALDNSGLLLSSGAWDITGGRLGNSGSLGGTRLSVTADSLDNSGTLLGAQALTIAAGQQHNSGLLNTDGLMTLSGTTLDNSGTVKAQGGLSAAFDGRIDNRANGQLLSAGRGEITTGVLSNQGMWQADNLTLASGALDNGGRILGVNSGTLQLSGAYTGLAGSELTSGGTLQLQADRLDSAGLISGTDTTVKAGTLQNGGVLQGYNGLTLNALQLDNSGPVQARQLDITTDGQLTNRGTLLGLTGLTLQSAGLNNVSGARLYSAGNLQLRTGTLTQEGELAALGSLKADIGGPFTLNNTLAAGDQLTLNVTGDLLQAGTLQGNGVTVSSTGTLTQQGRIVAGTGTSTLSAAAINQTASGSIQGGGPLSLLAGGNITNRGFVGTAADLLLQAGGLIDNSSLLYGGGNLQLLSDALVNRFGNILAGNSLWIQRDAAGNASSSVLNSSGTIETQRGDITVRTGTLTNQREGLTVSESSSSVADMPSWAGGNTAQIPVSWFKYEDIGVREEESGGSGSDTGAGNTRIEHFLVPYWGAIIQRVAVEDKAISVNASGGEGRFIAGGNLSVGAQTFNNMASSVQANGNIWLSGGQLNNQSYQSGRIYKYLTYEYEERLGRDSGQPITAHFPSEKDYLSMAGPNLSRQYGQTEEEFAQLVDGIKRQHSEDPLYYMLIGGPTTEYTPGQSYNATIQAGGAITANFAQNISNTGLQPGSGGFIPAIATPTLSTANGAGSQNTPASPSLVAGRDPLSLAGNSDPSLNALQTALAQLGGPSLNDYPLPTSQNGLFVADTSGNGRYLIRSNPRLSQLGQVDNSLFGDLRGLLGQTPGTSVPVETSPTLTDPTQFLGSSYLLGKLNLDAEHDYRFLGDAAFDTRYISNAVLSQTGQRYLNGVGSDLAQMQTLMDNAAAEKSRLNLQLGMSLSPEQVAGLSHSIVWWENITVDGQTVLAPKLYLAQADKTNLSGSRIVANSVSLSAGGDIDNRGSTVTALNALTVTSGGLVTNSEGGLLNAGGALNLVALGNLTNSSATIQGNLVTLASVNGDIINTTTTNQWHTQARDGRGSGSLTRTDIGQTGLITAQGGLTLQAGHDITLNGAQLSAGGPLALAAGNDIQLNALGTVTETVRQDGRATTQRRQQGLVQSTLASGGDLSLNAGRDLNGTAAQLSATGTMALSAGRDLTLLSAEQEQFSSNAWKRHLDWQQTVTQQGTVLNAGDGLSLRAGRDLTLQGAQAETRGALTVQAGRDLNLLSATESQHDFFEETTVKKGFLSKTTTHTVRESAQTTEKGTLLSAGSVALTAGHDITLQASAVAADKSASLSAGNDVNLVAGIEEQWRHEEQTKKKSGLMSGGGLGFTIGSQSTKAGYDGAETRQSAARSVVGASDGNVAIQAGRNVAVIGSDVIAGSHTPSNETGNISVIAENIAITPGIDTRDITTRFEAKSSGIGIALKGTPFDNYQNLRDIASVNGVTQKARLFAGELAAMAFDVPQLAISVGRQVSQSVQHTQGVYNSGSALTAAGDIQLRAVGNGQQDAAGKALSGDIVASGSAIHAGGDVLLDAARNIVLQSASDTEQTEQQSSNSGASFSLASPGISAAIRQVGGGPNHGVGMVPFASDRANERQSGNTLAQTASTISGQSVTLNSQTGDIRVTGSAISAVQDILLQANRGDVVITPGQNHVFNETNGSRHVIGDLGGDGYSGTVGWRSNTYHSLDDVSQQSGLRSLIQSGDGNVRVSAGENVAIAGADLHAGHSLLLSGRNVMLDPAMDTEHRTREQQSSQYGVTTALSGYVVSAAQSLEKLSQSVEDKRDPRLSAIYAAQTALDLATKSTTTQINGTAIKVTVSAGGGSSRSAQQQDKVSREGSTLYAGDDVQVTAAQDISATGVDIRGRNVDLTAGRSLTLTAAQSQDSMTGSSSGSQFGAGVGFGLGGTQNGFSIELSASGQKGREAGNSQTHQLSHVSATGTVNLSSGGDTTLNGAVVSGTRVNADVGGNLYISSVQDRATYDSTNTSAGVNVSICVPPICAGQTVSGNANLSQQILNNRYASVTEQSGIKAGEDGFAVRVNGHTQLDGAVLASTASPEKNRLETGTLGWRDIANASSYQGRGISMGASTDSSPVGGLLQTQGHASGTTRSAVAPGTILIHDASQSQDLGQLSRDTSGTLGYVADGFTRREVEDRLAIQKEITSLGVQAMDAYGAYKRSEAETAARERLTREGVPAGELEARIKLSEEVRQAATDYAQGSLYWQAGTALTAALSGGLGGNLQGALSGAAAPYLAKLVKDVSSGNEPVRIALHTVLGAFLARTQGGSAASGALGGFTAAAASGLIAKALYPDVEQLSPEQKQLVANLVMIAGAGVGGLAGGNLIDAGSAANTAKNEVENNALGADAGTALGFWFGKSDECDTSCKANIAKGVAEGNLIVASGVTIVAASAEVAVLARAALEGCQSAPIICLNEAGIITAESVVPGGVGAGGAIGVGKTASEAAVAKTEAVAVNALKNAGKETTQVKNLGDVGAFLSSQLANINKKLGTKIGQGRLPYPAGKEGVEQAKVTIKETLENATQISPVIPNSAVRGDYDLIHVYSSKTNSTVSLRILPDGKYEFDTLIPEKSSKFQ